MLLNSRKDTLLALGIVALNILILGVSGNRVKRMEGGTLVNLSEHRYVVAIYYDKTPEKYGWLMGGGAIISDWFILTAARTVDVDKRSKLVVVTGIRNPKTPDGELIAVKEIFAHPDYAKGGTGVRDNDIALILLRQSLVYGFSSNALQETYLPIHQVRIGEKCLLVGPQETREKPYLAVHKLDQALVDFKLCGEASNNGISIDDKFLCARLNSASIDRMDSGSPLMHNGHVVGILTQSSDQYVRYTKVFLYNEWIREKMALLYSF